MHAMLQQRCTASLHGSPVAAQQLQQQQQRRRHHHCCNSLIARGSSPDNPEPAQEANEVTPKPNATVVDRSFPKSGLFSIADPKAEVYSKAGERFDPNKKGGRFGPEFIWQTNWQEALKRQEDLERQQAAFRKQQAEGGPRGGTGPGVVSFARLGALDDLSVDLTEQLVRKKKQQADQAAAAAAGQQQPASIRAARGQQQQQQQQQRRAGNKAGGGGASPSYAYKDMPSQSEARRFKRAARVSGYGTVPTIAAVGQATPEEAAAKAAAVAAERVRYEAIKVEFQGWTLGLGLVGGLGAWALYGQDVAISYALGASAGLTYLRLLGRSVDAVGDQGVSGGMNGAIGQPRLLIPVVLALTYNRWNSLYATDYGVTLNLYGMLVGFFTYKLAVIGRQGLALLSELSAGGSSSSISSAGRSSSSSSGGGANGDGGASSGDDAMSLDRIFVRKVMSE